MRPARPTKFMYAVPSHVRKMELRVSGSGLDAPSQEFLDNIAWGVKADHCFLV